MSQQECHPGWHATQAALEQHPEQVLRIWLQKGRDDKRAQGVLSLAQQLGVAVEWVPLTVLEKYHHRHQGVIAWVRPVLLPGENELLALLDASDTPPLLLVLDGVQDPHNLGACLRTADAAGVQAVIVPKHNAVGLTPTVRKVACGAAESLPLFQVTNLVRVLEMLKSRGIWIMGLALADHAQSVYDVDWRGGIAIVMGAEDTGLRPLTMKHCDHLVVIPMLGSVQSLNVSVATGVVLYTALQQRLVKR
jgi:23S rRNA (guanosine2251-2'-O)-methyltransferase